MNINSGIRFDFLVRAATADPGMLGVLPYEYQVRLAEEGLPEFLHVPTGAGKTMAAVLPWLYRRRAHPDAQVRLATPRRLVLVLPQRSLVTQTLQTVQEWLANLDRNDPSNPWHEVQAHVLMGGVSSDDRAWKMGPGNDAVFVGTQDMVLSRLLMRGYGETRSAWPMSFGLLHTDTQYVIDEVQLMGPGLGTTVQLEGLRRRLGTAASSATMWMSATIRDDRLSGFPDFADLVTIGRRVGLGPGDESGPLAKRLKARREIGELRTPQDAGGYSDALAGEALKGHRVGSRTIVIVNTVDRARMVHQAVLRRLKTGAGHPQVVLLHSRFRPADRDRQTELALEDPGATGTLVLSTQVLEAGIDTSSRLMITEVAPWSSIVQRAGRCNRAGDDGHAQLRWAQPPGREGHRPYEEVDVKASAEQLRTMEGLAVTSRQLQAARVEESSPLYSVLRMRDLVDLFDTSPDLNGNDIDISRWIRDADERTVNVAWRPLNGAPPPEDSLAVHRDELCPVPIGELRGMLKRHRESSHPVLGRAWLRAQPAGTWNVADNDQIRPGGIVVLDCATGGYTAEGGWDPASTRTVAAVQIEEEERADPSSAGPSARDEDGGGENSSETTAAVTLTQHLDDVGREVTQLLGRLDPLPGLSVEHREAAVQAGYLHDLGKAHPVFTAAMRELMGQEAGQDTVWAKSGVLTGLRLRALNGQSRSRLRHELVSALMLLDSDANLLAGIDEPDLTAYLVAAHHGKVRISVRPTPDEPEGVMSGVASGDITEPVSLPDGRRVPAMTLSTAPFRIGGVAGHRSWTDRACGLRDRADLGPFRVAFLEAVVRSADWQVSASYDKPLEAQ